MRWIGRRDRTPASSSTPQILPSLPVKHSVLRQLGIAENDLPHGLTHLKHNLLLSPSETPSQESNICANSNIHGRAEFSVSQRCRWRSAEETIQELRLRLKEIIVQSPSLRRPDPDRIFKSLSYLDQIAIVCLAAGCRSCRASDCLRYRSKLESIVPVCRSWPGLRDWVLCITSCSMRTARDIYGSEYVTQPPPQDIGDPMTQNGFSRDWVNTLEGLLPRFRNHLTACIVLTHIGLSSERGWDITGKVPRPSINTQTFDPLQEGTHAAGPSVDVAEVFHLVAWFRNISRNDDGGRDIPAPFWYHQDFLLVATNAVEEASSRIVELGFCQKRVWEVARYSHDGGTELVPLVRALEHLPQHRHEGHESCSSGFCEDALKNYTSVTQLHKCLHSEDCVTTNDEMFNQSLLVAALNGNTMTTAWSLDGKSLVARDMGYLAISHVWSDGTGVGAWKAGQVNKCLWDFFVEMAEDRECDGVWWDTVCIPYDKAARAIALNNMHHNYSTAKCTVVHDLYLAGIEWKNDGSPCIALVLSPWFTRGWTALELLLSKRVFILFRQGDRYTLKDLDKEVLARHRILNSHAHWIATEAVHRLRYSHANFEVTDNLLSVLRARYTSWSRDQSIIAGLMCGLTDHATLPEQKITKKILVRLGWIDRNCLLHGLPTMSEPQFSWCPPRFVDIPFGGSRNCVSVLNNGTLSGRWGIWCFSKTHVDRGMIRPISADFYVRNQVQGALQKPEECVILTCNWWDSQGLLVRLKADKLRLNKGYCKYIGGVYVIPGEIRIITEMYVIIGYKPEMVDVEFADWSPVVISYGGISFF